MDGFSRYLMLGGVLFLASVLHSTVGFAFALFAIPVLLIGGLQPYEAIAICATSVIIHATISVWRSEVKPDWKQVFGMVAIGFAAQPVGVWILGQIVHLGRSKVGQIYGVILLAVLCVRLFLHPAPRERLHPVWGVLTMIVSGIISGMSGMGGPPIVLWLIAHKWSNDRIRVTLWTMFAMLAATNLGWQLYRFREETAHAIGLGVIFAPVMLLGRVPGAWISARLSPATMRHAVTAVLVVVALYAILQPLLLPQLVR